MNSSYSEDDVQILLTQKQDDMPEEWSMPTGYFPVAYRCVPLYAEQTAHLVANLAHAIHHKVHVEYVFVSIVRAALPTGILLKRYLKKYFNADVPHYAVSLENGLDHVAMQYIFNKHPNAKIIFVDGWCGKGTVKKKLEASCPWFRPQLALLVDYLGVADWCGTHNDVSVCYAPLNAVATGLIGRPVPSDSTQFDYSKYLEELQGDVSEVILDEVEKHFSADGRVVESFPIRVAFGETNFPLDRLNVGINEVYRALLRRELETVYVACYHDFQARQIIELARVRGIPVEVRQLPYCVRALSVAKGESDV